MIQVLINSTDRTSQVVSDSLQVEQVLTSQVDTARFRYRKYGSRSYTPAVGDNIEIYDGSTKIFGGKLLKISEGVLNGADGLEYDIDCVDHTYELDSLLVAKSYTNETIQDIIADIIASYAPTFTTANVVSTFEVGQIVFNQVSVSQCIKRLADIVKYDWYPDPNKDIHFFPKFTTAAPFNLTDTSGNYVVKTLKRKLDGTQIANKVKVRGGEYNAATYTDTLTVKGNDQKAFKLPYKFANLTVELDTGAGFVSKTVGIDFIDDFSTKDVLYNYNERTIKFNSALADGNRIRYSGNPKVRVLGVASDPASIALYGTKEKLIQDMSIEDIDTARKRAIAELNAFKDKLTEVTFDTYTAGLNVGMVINLNSSKRSANDDYLISKLSFAAFKPDTFFYRVTLVTTKRFELLEILQKILQPDDIQNADAEVVEDIRTDEVEISIAELITLPASVTNFTTLVFTENIYKDPLGAGVEPDWVLAPYFPSSHTDTKREGVLDYSLKVY